MSFVAAATTVGATVLGTGAAAGIGSTIVGGALIGAGIGGTYSALTGDGNILDSMLTGAGIGGVAGGIGGAFFPGAAGYAPAAGGVGVASNVPAVGAYTSPGISTSQQVANFANASSDPIGALAESGALSGGAGQTGITAANTGLSAKEMLGYGLGATTLMGLLGGKQEGVNAPGDKGMIRPFEYATSRREPEAGGRPYYFEPIQYDQYGKTTAPIDTSERNYFNQQFTPLPTYKAALGGQVPKLDNMPSGGLAAIQGMRDGYGANQTMDGNIPQFSNGGDTGDSTADLMAQYKKLKALNIQLEPKLEELANQKLNFQGEQSMPDRFILEKMKAAQPDQMRNVGQQPMGMVEGSQMMDRNAMYGGRPPSDIGIMPQSLSRKNLSGMANINSQLDDDTRLKLMASGYRNQMGSGIDRIGAGVTRQLDRDSDLSAFYERSPGTRDQMGGVKYSKRFNQGGMSDGDLGGYSDGGRLLRGPGDGVSDDIPATINNKQPARLADGEFVIPARIVSEIGNGSTDAGAKRLYAMMDKIQAGRKKTVGKGKVAVDSKAKKHLLA